MCRCHVFLQPTCSAVAHTSIGVVNAVYHLGVGLAIAWRSEFPTTTTILGLGAVAGNVASFAAIEALTIAAVTMTDTVTSRVVKLGRQLVQLGVEASKRIVLEFLGLGVPEFLPCKGEVFLLVKTDYLVPSHGHPWISFRLIMNPDGFMFESQDVKFKEASSGQDAYIIGSKANAIDAAA